MMWEAAANILYNRKSYCTSRVPYASLWYVDLVRTVRAGANLIPGCA